MGAVSNVSAAERRLCDSVRSHGRGTSRPGESRVAAAALRTAILSRLAVSDVVLTGLLIEGDLNLVGEERQYGLTLRSCELSGYLVLEGSGLARLELDDTRIGGLLGRNLQLRGELVIANKSTMTARPARDPDRPAISLVGARIGARVLMRDCPALVADRGIALVASGSQIGGDLRLQNVGISGKRRENGVVQFRDARIGGSVICDGLRITNPDGPAFVANHIQTVGGFAFDGDTTVEGKGELGALSLVGATIGSRLDLRGSTLVNRSGPALRAFGMHVSTGIFLDRDPDQTGHPSKVFRANGGGDRGAVRLDGSTVGGVLRFTGATITNLSGPAVTADGITVSGPVLFDDTMIKGSGPKGVVRLASARVVGLLDFSGCNIDGTDPREPGETVPLAPGFLAWNSEISAELIFDERSTVLGIVDLSQLKVGRLCFPPALVDRGPAVELDGLVYGGLPKIGYGLGARSINVDEGVAWLAQMPTYSAQPYQHLAMAFRSAGHEGESRTVLIAQQDRLRHGDPPRVVPTAHSPTGSGVRYTTRPREPYLTGIVRLRQQILWLTIGYGYQAWRALVGLILTMALAFALALGADAAHVANSADRHGASCAVADDLGLALDWSLPTFEFPDGHCDLAGTTVAVQGFLIASWALGVLGWAFSVLFIAGFTGLIRKV
jgi:hypothetical protein